MTRRELLNAAVSVAPALYDDKRPVPPQDLAMLIEWVRKHPPKKPLPKTSGLTSETRLALEDACNQQCIDYARTNLPL
jgi:hypothetical protein